MIKTALKRENIPLLFFYIAYAIELAILLIDKSAYVNPIEGRLFQLTFVLCTLKVVMTKYTNKEWALMVAFLALGAVSYFSTERNEIVRIVMFVAASKGIDIKKLLNKNSFNSILLGLDCNAIFIASEITSSRVLPESKTSNSHNLLSRIFSMSAAFSGSYIKAPSNSCRKLEISH